MSEFDGDVNEQVEFRLLNTPCCGQLLCWINPRFPNFCPECGARIYPEIRSHVLKAQDLWLRSKV